MLCLKIPIESATVALKVPYRISDYSGYMCYRILEVPSRFSAISPGYLLGVSYTGIGSLRGSSCKIIIWIIWGAKF
jgi:hypothetical protein